jgi:hypothetical protein
MSQKRPDLVSLKPSPNPTAEKRGYQKIKNVKIIIYFLGKNK